MYTKNYPREAFHEITETQSESTSGVWHLNYFFTPRTVSIATLATGEFEHGFGRNPDLLLRPGIKARARPSLLLDFAYLCWANTYEQIDP